jgi:hypothetical protein
MMIPTAPETYPAQKSADIIVYHESEVLNSGTVEGV